MMIYFKEKKNTFFSNKLNNKKKFSSLQKLSILNVTSLGTTSTLCNFDSLLASKTPVERKNLQTSIAKGEQFLTENMRKYIKEWASIVLNFNKCEVKGTLPLDSQNEMTRL